ncbi:MAG: 50S ribosomal protein L4 [Planctomycetes bacterium]|nr:50S ribosomal protein L4 [Planctomycetota bacterium]
MLELKVYDNEGKEIDKVSVDEALFGGTVNKKLLQEVVVMYQSNQRKGNASTKDRGEVEGSTKKPWKQKHTGRARAGTIRSPLWRHGGVVFGPHPRSYYYSIPHQLKIKALDSALLSKFKGNETYIVNSFNIEIPRTKDFSAIIKKLGIDPKKERPKHKCLLGIKDPKRSLHLSSRNIPGIKLMPITDLNAYDVIKYQRLMLTKEALEHLISLRK